MGWEEGRKEGRKKGRKEGKVPTSRSGAVALSGTCVLVVREKYLKTGVVSLYGRSDRYGHFAIYFANPCFREPLARHE